MQKRVGVYLWAGPGLIRMTSLKFFNPRIDVESMMGSYDLDYLAKLKNIFGITDVWAMYSFGFSELKEEEDYQFLESKLSNFKKLGLKVHAYLQGTNLVYEDFKDRDWWARDEKQRLVPYYRGRKVVCINNPEFVKFITNKANKLVKNGFDGMYVDNIMAGQIPISIYVRGVPVVFTGCRCKHCQALFKKETGNRLPRNMEKNPELTKKYLEFRTANTHKFIKRLSDVAHKNGLEFGTNSFDPLHIDTKIMYGFDVNELAKMQDYIMIENHSLPNAQWSRHNKLVDELAKKIDKPVFCVSYKKGIGFDQQYSQDEFDRFFSEAKYFNPCMKGTEYVTRGVWHNLRLEKLRKVKRDLKVKNENTIQVSRFNKIVDRIVKFPEGKRLLRKNYNEFLTFYLENRYMRKLYNYFYPLLITQG